MMISVNRIENSITGSANGKPFGVKYTEEKYKAMQALAQKANEAESMEDLQNILVDFEPFMQDGYKEIVETTCPNLVVNEETGKYFLKTTDGVTISSKPLPSALVERILTSVEKGIDFLPIIKFWTRLLRNPFYSEKKAQRIINYVNKTIINHELKKELIDKNGVSPATAVERATVYQTPITQEGLLCTYKVSKEVLDKFDPKTGEKKPRYDKVYDEDDGTVESAGIPDHVEDRLFTPAVMGNGGDAFFCYELGSSTVSKGKASHKIKVGRIHELESWDMVNTDDNQSCVKGLHVGRICCRLAA